MLQVLVILCIIAYVNSFGFSPISRSMKIKSVDRRLSMEYIPDGLTKKQWEEMKKKEAEAAKNKDLGKIGITKFQSRSFEAWQKSGQKNLFPVSPDTPLEARPYMMRPGGSADGQDLKAKGLKGKGFGQEVPKNEADAKYENQSPGFNLPWTSDSLKKFSGKAADTKSTAKKVESKPAPAKKEEAPKKGGFFGLF